MIFFNCCLAFTLNIAAIHLLSSTSAMVIGISGPLKDMMLVFISFVIFKDPITTIQLLGFSISLVGLYLYRAYKNDPNSVYDAPNDLLQSLISILQFVYRYIVSSWMYYRNNNLSSHSTSMDENTKQNHDNDDDDIILLNLRNDGDDDNDDGDDDNIGRVNNAVDDEAARPLMEASGRKG
jgi:hypothetical protein